MNEYFAACIIIVLVAGAFCAGLEIGLGAKRKALREQLSEIQDSAITAGVGEYYLDEKQEKKFRFIPAIVKELK